MNAFRISDLCKMKTLILSNLNRNNFEKIVRKNVILKFTKDYARLSLITIVCLIFGTLDA